MSLPLQRKFGKDASMLEVFQTNTHQLAFQLLSGLKHSATTAFTGILLLFFFLLRRDQQYSPIQLQKQFQQFLVG